MNDALLDRLARRDVDEEDLRRIEKHLGSCSVCAQKASDRASAARAKLRNHFLADAPAPLEHHAREELERYARRVLDPASSELVEAHLDECPECVRIVDGLSAQRRVRVRRTWLAAAAAVLVIAVIASLLVRRASVRPTDTPPIVKQQPENDHVQPRAPERVQIATAYADPEWNALVRNATQTGRLPVPGNLAELRGAEDVVRGRDSEVERVSPAGRVIDDVRPVFSWASRDGATYTVYVFDGAREIARSAALNTTTWTAPFDLPRGRMLTWQVEAARGEIVETIPRPPTPSARFRIITTEDQRNLSRARDLHAGDDLLLGLLYARAGMLDEARASLQRAAEQNPAARRLLESLPKG